MTRLVLALCLSLLSLAAQALPQIEQWTTANGARVRFVATHEIPIVDLRVVFDAAASRDGNQPGLAKLTTGMLNEGAGGLSATQLAERLDDLGAQLELDSLRDMAFIGLRSLADPEILTPGADLVATVLTRPDFPAVAFDRVRKQTLVGLRYAEQRAGTRASNALFAALYGDHPYAHNDDGTEAVLNTLTPDDARRFHDRYFVAANAIVVIVGDLDRAGAEALAERVIGGLPRGTAPAPIPPAPEPAQSATVRLDHPGQQTHILIGAPVARRGDPDWFPLYVGNQILGGAGLNSRLADEVREKRGLAYSAGSGFSPMRVAGPFLLSAQTRNDQTGETLAVMRETLDRFIADGPTQDELDAVKENLRGGFPLRIASNANILDYVAMIAFYSLPADYLARFDAQIAAVTAAEVRDAFRRRVHPGRMVTVLVGGGANAGP